MKEIPPIKAVMTPFPYSVQIEQSIAEARKMMREHDIRHLPVMQREELVGIVSDRDIKLALDPGLGLPGEDKLTVRNVCVRDAYVVGVSEPLDAVLMEMARRHIGSALVVKQERLVGIFTVTDACRHFARFLRQLFPRGGGDDAA